MIQSGRVKTAVFLDRDGVVNRAIVRNARPFAPRRIEEVEVLAGVTSAVNILKASGLELIVVTNQPDIANGHISQLQISQFHKKIESETGINNFYVCAHNDRNQCNCRKPKIGLLLRASAELGISLEDSYMVGDRWKDVVAGQSAGCKCFFIDSYYSERKPPQPYVRVNSLLEAALLIRKDFSAKKP